MNCFIALDDSAMERAAARRAAVSAPRGPVRVQGRVRASRAVHRRSRDVRLELGVRRRARPAGRCGAISLGRLNLDPLCRNRRQSRLRRRAEPLGPGADRRRLLGRRRRGVASARCRSRSPPILAGRFGFRRRSAASPASSRRWGGSRGRARRSPSRRTRSASSPARRRTLARVRACCGPRPGGRCLDPGSRAHVRGARCVVQGTRLGFDPERSTAQRRRSRERRWRSRRSGARGRAGRGRPLNARGLRYGGDRLDVGEASAVHGAPSVQPGRYAPAIRARLELALSPHGADHVNAMRLQGRALTQLLDGPLAAAGVLAVPTVAAPAVTIDSLQQDAVSVSGRASPIEPPLQPDGCAHSPSRSASTPLACRWGFSWSPGLGRSGRCSLAHAAYQAETDWHRRLPPRSGASSSRR